MDIITLLIVGAIAGWLAGVIIKGGGFGLVGDIILGIVGAFIGSYLLGMFDVFPSGLIGAIITATIGAAVLLSVIKVVRK